MAELLWFDKLYWNLTNGKLLCQSKLSWDNTGIQIMLMFFMVTLKTSLRHMGNSFWLWPKFQLDLFFHQLDSDTWLSEWYLAIEYEVYCWEVWCVEDSQKACLSLEAAPQRGARGLEQRYALFWAGLLRDPAHLWVKSVFLLEVLVMWVSRKAMQGWPF